jgi:hypothetical protein
MDFFGSAATAVIGVGLYDWLTVTGAASKAISFDYRYFPFSKARIISVIFLSAATFYFCITIRPDSPPIPPIILGLAALAAHFAVSLIDLFAQRKTGYRTPLNYGERDET